MNNKVNIDGAGNIVIQDITGASIIVNPDNSSELRQLIMDFSSQLEELPKEVLSMIESRQDLNAEIKVGAHMHFTVLADLHENVAYRRLKFGLTITNTTKENRYFNQPFFKVHPKFEIKGSEQDTFVMIPENGSIFPKRLEYGEPVFASYEIKTGAYEMYQEILKKDDEAYLQGFVSTTVGELYESNKFYIKKLFEHLKWLKQ